MSCPGHPPPSGLRRNCNGAMVGLEANTRGMSSNTQTTAMEQWGDLRQTSWESLEILKGGMASHRTAVKLRMALKVQPMQGKEKKKGICSDDGEMVNAHTFQ